MGNDLIPPDISAISAPLPPEEEKAITLKEAEEAAADAGLSVIRVKRLEASAKLGQFIEQLGAQRIGRTTLVIAQEAVEDGIKQCDSIIAKADSEEGTLELMVEILKIRQGFTDQMIKTGSAQMKGDEKAIAGGGSQKTLNIPFPPGSRIAVQSSPAEVK